jgi:hypothetical protein
VDSRSCASPLGSSDTGANPTDRAKKGSKIHILVDQRGAPLSVWIRRANQHDKWSKDDLVIHIIVNDLLLINISVLIKDTIILTYISLLLNKVMQYISSIVAEEMKR